MKTLIKTPVHTARRRGVAGLVAVLLLAPFLALGSATAANAWVCQSPLPSTLNYSAYFPASNIPAGGQFVCGGHKGVDFYRGGTNFTVPTVYGGKVTTVGFEASCHGNYVIVKHADGNYSIYAHLATVSVSVGQTIGNTAVIGTAGSTGDCTSANHLHLSMTTSWTGWNTTNFFDPKAFLDSH